MKLFASRPPHLLFVQPHRAFWCDGAGQALAQTPPAHETASIVADLIEETHVRLEIPGLFGADRASFIQGQLQTLLPDVPMRATWQTTASQPFLPKPFVLNAVGVSSQMLQTALAEQMGHNRPVAGVWTLSYLIARWAMRNKLFSAIQWALVGISLPHGLRLVLLRDHVPVFSRLLLDSAAQQQAQELAQTLKYLVDTRVMPVGTGAPVMLLQAPPGLADALQALRVQVLPPPVVSAQGGVLAEILALAGPGAPGQLASAQQRRHFLAVQARKAVGLAAGVVAIGGAFAVYQQSMGVLQRFHEIEQWGRQGQEMEREAKGLQQTLASSSVNLALMRLAIEVQQRELLGEPPLRKAMWQLGQVLQAQPQARLRRMELTLVPVACDAPTNARSSAPKKAFGGDSMQVQWSFDVAPAVGLSPLARQAVLDQLSKAVRGMGGWRVAVDPVQSESSAAIDSGQPRITGSGSAWRWCLTPPETAQTGNVRMGSTR